MESFHKRSKKAAVGLKLLSHRPEMVGENRQVQICLFDDKLHLNMIVAALAQVFENGKLFLSSFQRTGFQPSRGIVLVIEVVPM